jgi:hypothetical protein
MTKTAVIALSTVGFALYGFGNGFINARLGSTLPARQLEQP